MENFKNMSNIYLYAKIFIFILLFELIRSKETYCFVDSKKPGELWKLSKKRNFLF